MARRLTIKAQSSRLKGERERSKKGLVIVITGIAGIGKTSFGQQLSEKLDNSVIIDKDTINDAFLRKSSFWKPFPDAYCVSVKPLSRKTAFYLENVRFQTYHCMLKIAQDNLQAGKIPILDGNYHKEISNGYLRGFLIPFFENLNSQVKFILCHADEATMRERIENRNAERDSEKLISDKQWKSFLAENPSVPEEMASFDHIKVDLGKPLQRQFSAVLSFLGN